LISRGGLRITDPIRLAMLYSAPLVWRDELRDAHPIDMLDFEAERDLIFESLKETGRSIEVRTEAATADNFSTLVLLGCRALHYSGHGHPDFLAFEDGRGEAHPLDPETLKELFASGGPSGVELAFVSACHSRKAGEAFVEAGVPHVVCVRLEEPVYDLAARKFARTFYLALAAGKTVRQAFDSGRASVKATPNLPGSEQEAEKFLLLPEYAKHDVAVFGDALPGEFVDDTQPMPPKKLRTRAKPGAFIGRREIMQEVVSDLLDDRLVTIHGGPGIGKTALANEAGHYINERRIFPDGTFFADLRGAASTDAVRFAIATALEIEVKDDTELFAALSKKRCLLVLDNCEDPLHHISGGFRKFITELLQQADGAKLLLTSRHALGGGISGAAEKVHHLRQLDRGSAARLFVKLAPRDLKPSEVGTDDPSKVLRKLMDHSILDFLSGHPHAISLAVPLLQDKTLSQLYEMLKSQPLETLVIPDVPEEELDAARSFAVSIAVSVGYMRERKPEAIRLFAVMGLLPSGALPPDLDAIWGEEWQPLMDALVRASLVEREEFGEIEHFFTFPFVTAYADRLLTKEDRIQYTISACEHFVGVIKSLYDMMTTEKASKARILLSLEEDNLWACLDLNRVEQQRGAETESSASEIATYLPLILLFASRFHDGIQAAELGYKFCKALDDLKGEGGTLFALGSLKKFLYDREGAKDAFERALPLYQKIRDKHGEANILFELGQVMLLFGNFSECREYYLKALSIYQHLPGIEGKMGKANCLQRLGHLLIVRNKPDSAIKKLYNAFKIHIEIQEPLGIAADLGHIGQALMETGQHGQSVIILDMSLSIHRNIESLQGQATDLRLQGQAFWNVDELVASIAALWQAHEIFNAIGSPFSREMKIDEIFEIFKNKLGDETYQSIMSQIGKNTEEWRKKPLDRLQKDFAKDPLIKKIMEDLSKLSYQHKQEKYSIPTRLIYYRTGLLR